MHAHQLYNSQFEYDNAAPPEDPPELSGDALTWRSDNLINGEDTDLVAHSKFQEFARERIYDLLDIDHLFEFIRSNAIHPGIHLSEAARPIVTALKQIADEMLIEAHNKAIKERGL